MEAERYRRPTAAASAEVRDRGSVFLALLAPCTSAAASEALLVEARRRHPDATHHCWALCTGWPPQERASDAGEPAGTAGKPMLQVLRGAGLSDVSAIVVRWFGGTKLGKGGLARAYAAAVRAALAALPIEAVEPTDELEIELAYERLGAVKRLLRPPAIELAGERYGERVTLVLRCARRSRAELAAALAELGLAAQEPGAASAARARDEA